jgi:hypothetical protein
VIFLVILLMGLLAGQFFFTWQRRVKMMPEFTGEQASPNGPPAEGGSELPAGRTPMR